MCIINQEKVDLDSLTGTETTIHFPYTLLRIARNYCKIQKFDASKQTWVDCDDTVYSEEQAKEIVKKLNSECTDDDKVKIKSSI